MFSMSRHNRLPALVALVAFTVGTIGCSSWHPMPTADPTSDEWEQLIGKKVRLHTDDGAENLRVERVEYPYLYGEDPYAWKRRKRDALRRIDLREVHKLEISDPDTLKSVLLFTGIVIVTAGVIFAVIVAKDFDEL